jgi:hypothetical protein|uniref:Uncharacterized protein n=1 Tax=viral metagenome TaxID=1070528 RepID=A0A6C0JCT3_9ZZZZ
MGRTARFEQIYVASLEAEPVENETLTGVNSILTREIEVNEVKINSSDGVKGRLGLANNIPTKQFSLGTELYMDKDDTHVFDLKASGRANRFFVNQNLAVGTVNPSKAFQVNAGAVRKVDIDIEGHNLMTVSGNLVSTNVIVNDKLSLSNIVIDGAASNIISVNGGIKTSNLSIGSNVAFFDNGPGTNVGVISGDVYQTGNLHMIGNLFVTGNVTVSEVAKYIVAQDLRVSNIVIHSGFGNDVLSRETGYVMTPGVGYSNVAIAFVGGARGREMGFFQTTAYGGLNSAEIPKSPGVVNVHVSGDIYTSNAVGVANIFPTHDLCVGSNLFVEDTGSNVLEVHGNTYTQKLKVGSGGISVGNLLTMLPGEEAPVVINSNVRMNALRTTGTTPSGISNVTPTDTLSIGSKIYANLTAADTLTIFGNTATTNLITESVSSTSNIIIHADRYGGDSVVNPLVLKSGPSSSNVSSIEIFGASTSNTHQNIRFKTKNTERMKITSNGHVGINETNPTQRLTVNGNAFVMGSNVMMFGNLWGTTSNTSMQMFSSPNVGENKVENIVKSGKGLNFYASTTPTMGTPKLTILESSNVGINVANPIGALHTTGGTVFINNQVVNRGTYVHQETPMVITNTYPITSTTDMGRVLDLSREGNGTQDGVRASFKLGKHETSTGTSKSRFDLYLASDNYETDNDVMTWLSTGKVGIGHTQPSAHLEVMGTGIGDPTRNGILVHNHDNGDAIIAAEAKLNVGNAYTSYILENGGALTGWTTGVTKDNDFRITENYQKVLDPGQVALYINNGTRNVGVGTDQPRAKLEVSGNLVVGNEITFGGTLGDEYGNTRIIDRIYGTQYTQSELLLYKGNNDGSVNQGPDRIRHIAGEHVFQTYTTSGGTLYGGNQILETMDAISNKSLVITDLGSTGIVVIGGNRTHGAAAYAEDSGTKLVVNGSIVFTGSGSFKTTGLEFSTTELGASYNIIRSAVNGNTRRPITFAHGGVGFTDSEFFRFDNDGRIGMGTTQPTSNIHVYDTTPSDINLLKLQSTGVNKQTGALLYTNEGEGGFIKGFNNTVNRTTGLALGVANNSTIVNNLNLIHTSNVGVGTPSPLRQLHILDSRTTGENGTMRVESLSSNASIELTTSSGGNSNIYADRTGNVYIQPSSDTTFVDSDLIITGDLAVQGNFAFTELGVNLGSNLPTTDFEVGGGAIFGSQTGGVQRKFYSKSFQITTTNPSKDIQLIFGTGAFYAKVIAMLRRTDGSTTKDLSTMILELQGGSGDENTPSDIDVAVGTKNIFGGTNNYPWSSTVITGQRGISITPYNEDITRDYYYDISVELMTASGGKLVKITSNLTDPLGLDNGNGGARTPAWASFDY